MRTLLFLLTFLTASLPCAFGIPISATLAAYGVYDSLVEHDFDPQDTNKDIEVRSIQPAVYGPPVVREGETYAIIVVVANNGTEEETFTLVVRDDTDDKQISSQQVTLAATMSKNETITWDTTGATGGPEPVDPTFPGALHSLKATVTLAGDTVPENDSKTLIPEALPGIYVIAAPKPTEITFPVSRERPQARDSYAMASEVPSIETEKVPLSEPFVGPIRGQGEATLSSPPVSTTPAALSSIFRSPVDSEEGLSLDKPAITTVGEPLWGTLRGRIRLQGRSSSLGSYVEIGGEITFAERDGNFLVQRPQGSFSMTARAPGYLSVTIPNLSLEPGETLALSPVQLRFGDADGNGVIDILDLTVAALNHGQVSQTTSRP